MSGSDVLYISQLESQLAPSKTNRLTLGGLISKLGDDSPVPAKVYKLPSVPWSIDTQKASDLCIFSTWESDKIKSQSAY